MKWIIDLDEPLLNRGIVKSHWINLFYDEVTDIFVIFFLTFVVKTKKNCFVFKKKDTGDAILKLFATY